jgi:hypothetical protein
MVLAMGTTSMTAGMSNITLIGAIIAAATHQHLGAELCSAELHSHQSLFMAG